jgi:hypothetical protein
MQRHHTIDIELVKLGSKHLLILLDEAIVQVVDDFMDMLTLSKTAKKKRVV